MATTRNTLTSLLRVVLSEHNKMYFSRIRYKIIDAGGKFDYAALVASHLTDKARDRFNRLTYRWFRSTTPDYKSV